MSNSIVPCPHCGADISVTARFCRHCGSSDADGWREDEDDDFADDFDYDDYVRQNFSETITNTQTRPLWRLVAVILLALFAMGFLLF